MAADFSQQPRGERTALATAAEVVHLVNVSLPDVHLPATTASQGISLSRLAVGVFRLVLYAYPAIGAPGRDLLAPDWMTIPGAFGCTAESCSFRDLNSAIRDLGAGVCGLSTQPAGEQQEAAQRLSLNFPLLSDAAFAVTDHLGLPTWTVAGHRLLKRFTIIACGPVIEHVFAPVGDPAAHADEVANWLHCKPASRL